MIIRICAFTEKGFELVNRISEKLSEHLFEIKDKTEDTKAWTEESFRLHAPIVFVGATAIAVRMIAPFAEDKLSDSPVIVIDENGQFAIPILSGHIGGANALSNEIALAVGGVPVITTATDVNGLFSVDVFAKNNGLSILNRQGIKAVSSKLLKEKKITLLADEGIEVLEDTFPKEVSIITHNNETLDTVDVFVTVRKSKEDTSSDTGRTETGPLLTLCPKKYILGIGCKKDTPYENIQAAVDEALMKAGISCADIAMIASIDLKAKERGLLVFSSINRLPLKCYSADELNALKGDFSESEFVKSVTGVSNVCERAAMLAGNDGAKLILNKQASNGVTVAVAERKVVLHG